MTHRATAYRVTPSDYDAAQGLADRDMWTLSVEWTGSFGDDTADCWAIRRLGRCLNRKGEWEYEANPSSRTKAFLKRCRYPLEDALRRAEIAVEGLIVNGMTLAEAHAYVQRRNGETP